MIEKQTSLKDCFQSFHRPVCILSHGAEARLSFGAIYILVESSRRVVRCSFSAFMFVQQPSACARVEALVSSLLSQARRADE